MKTGMHTRVACIGVQFLLGCLITAQGIGNETSFDAVENQGPSCALHPAQEPCRSSDGGSSNIGDLHNDRQVEALADFESIVLKETTFRSASERTLCQNVVNRLTEEQREQVAQISYAYWYLFHSSKHHDYHGANTNRQIGRQHAAMKEIQRHVVAYDPDASMTTAAAAATTTTKIEDEIVAQISNVVEVRARLDIASARSCFDGADFEAESHCAEWRADVGDDLSKQLIVNTQPDDDRPVIVFKFPRSDPSRETNRESYLRTQYYAMERAIAAIEYAARHSKQQDKVIAILDYSGGSSQSPPLSWQLTAIRSLQTLYPDRLAMLVIWEAPFMMRQIYRALRPFLSASIREMVHLLISDEDRAILESVPTLQAMFQASQDGIQKKPEFLPRQKYCVDYYIDEVPFHKPYPVEIGDHCCGRDTTSSTSTSTSTSANRIR